MIDFRNVKSVLLPEGAVSSISLGGKTLWRNVKYKRELAYLESSGTQYIDTGVLGIDGVTADITVWRTTAATNECFCGAYDGSQRLWLAYTFGGNWYRGYNNSAGSITPSTPIEKWVNIKTSTSGGKITYDVDGYVDTRTYKTGFELVNNVYLFGMGTGKQEIYSSRGRISYCKLYDNGTLVRDFIPVLDWNDVPCMYDKVSDELFYNKGTGEFVVGNDLNGDV